MGYTIGLAESLKNASIKYTYHKHVDGKNNEVSGTTIYSLTNPGGCYVAKGHTHNKTGNCSTATGTRTDRVPVGTCSCATSHSEYGGSCGHGDHGCVRCGVQIYGDKTVSYSYYTCGEPTNTWILGCGKTDKTIESATITFDN